MYLKMSLSPLFSKTIKLEDKGKYLSDWMVSGKQQIFKDPGDELGRSLQDNFLSDPLLLKQDFCVPLSSP